MPELFHPLTVMAVMMAATAVKTIEPTATGFAKAG